MSKKRALVALVSVAALALLAFGANHYIALTQVSKATGISIPFTSSISSAKDGGMMGGTIETWVEASKFSALLAQCTSDSSYSHGIINYSAYRVVTSQFEERGMGQSHGCIKEIKSKNSTKLIAIDNGFVYISEQWL